MKRYPIQGINRDFKEDLDPLTKPSKMRQASNKRRMASYAPMPRWLAPDDLHLKEVTKVVSLSQYNGFWYHTSPAGANEVRGPYRTRTLASRAYECFLADQVALKAEVVAAAGHKG